MSDYEYIDTDGDKIEIMERHACNQDQIYICTPDHGATIKPEDAPAVALAILEAAGIEPDDIRTGDGYTREAVHDLRRHMQCVAEGKEREAEDAKVRAFRAHQWKAQDENRDNVMPAWDDIDNYGRDLWRTEYRAARAFFLQEDDANTARALRDLGICHHDDTPTGDLTTEELAEALGHKLPDHDTGYCATEDPR